MVMGPAPPGTQVIAPATCETSSACTSPTTLNAARPGSEYALEFLESGTAFMPMSTTTAPGLIQSLVTISGAPTPTTTTSASRTARRASSRARRVSARSFSLSEKLWYFFRKFTACVCSSVVDAAPASRISHDMGMPTTLLSPTTATALPRTSTPSLRSSSAHPSGAHGMNAGRQTPRMASLPTLLGCSPSTSFLGFMHSRSRLSLRWPGTGSCSKTPCTSSSSLSRRSTARTVSWSTSPGRCSWKNRMPAASHASPLRRTYSSESARSPTTTAARPGGGTPSAAPRRATASAISRFQRVACRRPSSRRAGPVQ